MLPEEAMILAGCAVGIGKMTARLQAATTSGKPILLRVDYDAGHGVGSTKTQVEQELADEWSFLFWQFGITPFQASGRDLR